MSEPLTKEQVTLWRDAFVRGVEMRDARPDLSVLADDWLRLSTALAESQREVETLRREQHETRRCNPERET